MRGQSNSLLQWAYLFGVEVEDYSCFISVSQEQKNEHKTHTLYFIEHPRIAVFVVSVIFTVSMFAARQIAMSFSLFSQNTKTLKQTKQTKTLVA